MNHENAESCGPTVPEKLPIPEETFGPTVAVSETSPVPQPEKPVIFTRKMFKEYLRWHFTVRHGVVKACGHKFSETQDPRHNCDSCWFAYFNNNKTMTEIADDCFRNAGRDVLERSRGKKFVRYFLRFMSTIARFQREAAEAQKEKTNGEAVISGGGNSDGGNSNSDGTQSSIGQLAGATQTLGGLEADRGYVGEYDYGPEGEVDKEPTE